MAGAASGVAVEDGCVQAFLDIKRKRAHRFVLYRIGAQTTTAARRQMQCAAPRHRANLTPRRADDDGKQIISVQKSAPTVRVGPRCGAGGRFARRRGVGLSGCCVGPQPSAPAAACAACCRAWAQHRVRRRPERSQRGASAPAATNACGEALVDAPLLCCLAAPRAPPRRCAAAAMRPLRGIARGAPRGMGPTQLPAAASQLK